MASHELCLFLQNHYFSETVHEGDQPGKWLIASGASSHYSPFHYLFSFLSPISVIQILTSNGFIHAFFQGTIPLVVCINDSTVRNVTFENVLFVPTLQSHVNVFTIVVLANNGISATCGPDAVHFSRNGSLLACFAPIGSS